MMWAMSPNLRIKLNKMIFWGGGGGEFHIFLLLNRREKEGEKKKSFQNLSLRSTEFCLSKFVGSRTKVHLFDEGYTWVLKRRDFTEDPKEEILGNQIFRD